MSVNNCHEKTVRIERHGGKRVIRWLTVFAVDEQDGILVAHEVVEGFAQFL